MSLDAVFETYVGDPDLGFATEAVQWATITDERVSLGFAGSAGDTILDDETYFDIASVSKLFTATAALIAVDRGLVDFDTPIETAFDASNGLATFSQLLNHSSGYPAWDKYYERYPFPTTVERARENRTQIASEIVATAALTPPGLVEVYSDLGYMLLGHWVERLFDRRLDEIVAYEIVDPLALSRTRYVVEAAPLDAVRTELDSRRPHVTDGDGAVRGVVHDENCYIQGGAEGHAGLFSTARDLVTFAAHMRDVASGEDGIVTNKTLTYAWDRARLAPGGHHVLGWDTPSGKRSAVGTRFSRDATVGHLGFTGTSLWIDRSTGAVAALLTNRVYPTRENPRILDLRIAFHDAVQ